MAQPLSDSAALPVVRHFEVARPGPAPASAAPPWGNALRIAFRFVFSYLVLYLFPSPLDRIPGGARLDAACLRLWQAVVAWTAARVLHLGKVAPLDSDGGTGDSTANFVRVLAIAVLAAAATLVWTLLDRRSRDHRRLHAGLRVYVRYVLGWILLTYGVIKVIKTQFLFPAALRLDQAYGELSPMGLLWTFMGYSTPYNLFVGAAESAAGILLLFRRTTTLGALLAVVVMANVAMINFSYDVPVKLFALHLLLMGVFLLAPDLRRLADLLVLNRPTVPARTAPARRGPRWLEICRGALQVLAIGYILVSVTKMGLDRWHLISGWRTRAPAAGYSQWGVDDFVRNGRPVPSRASDAGRWRALTFGSRGAALITMDYDELPLAYDPARQTLTVASRGPGQPPGRLACSHPDADHLLLTGTLGNDAVVVTLHRIDPERFFLVNHRFHWIDESPDDR
jgi:uncharacterized membrane protein YphA (DoxX/SURF4 family)